MSVFLSLAFYRSRIAVSLLASATLIACGSSGTDQAAPPAREAVINSYVETGVSEETATCIVGIASKHFTLEELREQATLSKRDVLLSELIAGCEQAASLAVPETEETPSLAFNVEPNTFGDDVKLDALWTKCEDGDGAACDLLFEQAPVGSEYEEFGVTCGNRLEVLICSDGLGASESDPASGNLDRTEADSDETESDEAESDESEID